MREDGSATFTLPLDRILEDGAFTIRIFFGDIDRLAVQLMTEGQHEPIKVRQEGTQFFVVDGHRRQRALARARHLKIEQRGARFVVLEQDRPLREAPGPLHRSFERGLVRCQRVDGPSGGPDLVASQLVCNSGKPFTLLERMIFLSRLSRIGTYTREQLALWTGFSRTHIANAQSLNAADPRLIECVREGRLSQKLALRLLRAFSPDEQMGKVTAAMADADRHHRDRILPKDVAWGRIPGQKGSAGEGESVDPVRARLFDLVSRLGEAVRFAPNPAALDRLQTLNLIERYAAGKLSYARIEAHLLGRQ